MNGFTSDPMADREHCERGEQVLFGSLCVSVDSGDAAPHHTARSETHSANDVHNVHDVHTDHPAPEGDLPADVLADASDPSIAELEAALATIEEALSHCTEDPGVLAGEAFTDAARLVRERSPQDWFRLRGRIKEAARVSGLKLADIDRSTRPEGEGDTQDDSTVTDEIVALVQGIAELFHAADGTCYATLKGDGPKKTYRLDTQVWAQWASYSYYVSTATESRPGRAASETAIRTARIALTGIATHEGDERPVYLRAARHGETYLIDLGTDDWSAVEVSATGWQVVARPPVHFWRPGTLRPLPMPTPGGDLSRLWRYANIPEADRPLVLAWMLDAWRPETPFAILELTGQQGTAKSSTQAKIRQCLDPNAVDLRAAPKSVEDLFVSAGANWVASLNNLSHLSAQMQDALCGLATGGGFAARTLYTNADETLVDAKRPVALNGIVPVVTAQDLTDRVVHIDLPELGTYRTEVEIDAEFEADAPHILGGLLDLFSAALAVLPRVRLPKPPRMADYARLGEAVLMAQGKPPGFFLALYTTNRKESVGRSLEASPVACAVRTLVDGYQGQSALVWTGTMKALLDTLSHHRDGAEAWPKSPRGLGDALRRQRPALSQVGIEVTIGTAGRDGVHVSIQRRVNIGEHCEHRERGLDGYSPGALCTDTGSDRV